jgi:WhiB family redox-sensing transcriptional regulator
VEWLTSSTRASRRDLAWMARGRCRGSDPSDWYPVEDHPPTIGWLRGICRKCDVQSECAEWAIANEDHGVWAGLTEKDRRKIKKRREAQSQR